MTMTSQFADMTSSSNFFDVTLFLLSSLVTGPGFMSISSLVLELWQFTFTRVDQKSGNTLVWVLPNIWGLRRVRDTKFATDVPNKMLLNVATSQVYSFYPFWVSKGKPTGGEITLPLPPLRLGLNTLLWLWTFLLLSQN